MSVYVLTADAEEDLRSIIQYTRKQWGAAQVRRYVAALEQGMVDIAAGKSGFTIVDECYPGLRMAHIEHHYVFCLPREGAPALVAAIFHERMDLMRRLGNRLMRPRIT